MPEFISSFEPDAYACSAAIRAAMAADATLGILDVSSAASFCMSYFACAEWTYSDCDENGRDISEVPDDCEGWHASTLTSGIADCLAFMRDNAGDLVLYEESTGRDMSSAGNDFWLTRNRHGAGFWDRGSNDCLKRLSDAARVYGSVDAYMGNDSFLYFM